MDKNVIMHFSDLKDRNFTTEQQRQRAADKMFTCFAAKVRASKIDAGNVRQALLGLETTAHKDFDKHHNGFDELLEALIAKWLQHALR